jgi:two-component system sensor histidine kinase RegB
MLEMLRDIYGEKNSFFNSSDSLFREKVKWLFKLRTYFLFIPFLLLIFEGSSSLPQVIIFVFPFMFWIFYSGVHRRLEIISENLVTIHLYTDVLFFLFFCYLFIHQVRHLWIFVFLYSFLAASILRNTAGLILYVFLNIILYFFQKNYYYIFVNPGTIDPYLPYILNTIVFVLAKSLTRQIDTSNDVLNGLKAKSLENDRLRALGSLMSGISHEFGTPINTLKIIIERYRKTEKVILSQNDIKVLSACITNLEKTLKKINNSNLSDKEEYSEEVNLKALFDDLFVVWIEDKCSVDFNNIIHQELVLKINLINFTQMIFNFFDNSLEATGLDKKLNLCIESIIDRDSVKIKIKDNGLGIEASLRNRIGDPFFTTKSNGTGLGVYSSILYLNSCGGDLFFEHKDFGVDTIISLPLNYLVKNE